MFCLTSRIHIAFPQLVSHNENKTKSFMIKLQFASVKLSEYIDPCIICERIFFFSALKLAKRLKKSNLVQNKLVFLMINSSIDLIDN